MSYQEFLRKSTYRRYGIFIATIIFSYYTIQAYVNNKSIDVSIESVKEDIVNIEEEIAFMDKFYTNYLQTEYATYFLWHENWQIYWNERIIRFANDKEETDFWTYISQQEQPNEIYLATPRDSRNYFLESKLEELDNLWILSYE